MRGNSGKALYLGAVYQFKFYQLVGEAADDLQNENLEHQNLIPRRTPDSSGGGAKQGIEHGTKTLEIDSLGNRAERISNFINPAKLYLMGKEAGLYRFHDVRKADLKPLMDKRLG